MVGIRSSSQFVWVVLLAGLAGSHAQPLSNVPRQDFWVTDGAVNAIAVTNDRVFIGGDFRYVGPYTGGGVPVDVNTMQPVAKYPKVNGSVHAVEPDGQGGWFIGGLFTTVGGRPRTNLAHITAAGEVNTNWVVHATGGGMERGLVEELVLEGATLYVGGTFTNLGGLPRSYAGALDPMTGSVRPWAPQPNSDILAMAVSPAAVYLAGKFTSLGGLERGHVGAVDKTAGQVLSWNPWDPAVNPLMVALSQFKRVPFAISVLNGRVILPGRFDTAFATVTLAGFDESTATLNWLGGVPDQVYDLEDYNHKLYVAGQFEAIGGDGTGGAVPRRNLAEFDPATGLNLTGWNPQLNVVGDIRSLAFLGNSVFATGTFSNQNPFDSPRTNANHIVQVDLTSGATIGAAQPFNNGPIWAAASQGDTLYLGGAFTSLAGVEHEYLAELSLRDGSLQPWKPKMRSGVSAMAISGGRLLTSGAVESEAGSIRRGLVAFDLQTLQLTDWNPQVEWNFSGIGPAITRILPHEGDVFVAGDFYAINGQSRSNLARLDLGTGQVLGWRADANGRVEAIELGGAHLYVGGGFSTVGGAARPYLARVGLDSAQVDVWQPQPSFWVTHLSANSSALYVSGWFDSLAGQGRRGAAAFSLQTGELLPWSVDAYSSPPSGSPVLATDSAIYSLAGFFLGPDVRQLVELAPDTAWVQPWNTHPYTFNSPKRLLKAGGRLFVVGGLDAFHGPTRHGLAVYEPAGFSVFRQVEHGGDALNLRLSADQGRQVIVERTTDFNNWTGVSTNIAWEGILALQDTNAPVDRASYRAYTNPP